MIAELSIDQLNRVPSAFNNNIIWNIGHLTAAQQGICYQRSGLSPVLADNLVTPFRGGTRPENFFGEQDIQQIKEAFIQSIDQLGADYAANCFIQYEAWKTRYGVEIKSIEDAIKFLPYHEGLHGGSVIALKKLVV